MLSKMSLSYLLEHNIQVMEITVTEAPNQSATYRCPLPADEEAMLAMAAAAPISRPRPCFDADA